MLICSRCGFCRSPGQNIKWQQRRVRSYTFGCHRQVELVRLDVFVVGLENQFRCRESGFSLQCRWVSCLGDATGNAIDVLRPLQKLCKVLSFFDTGRLNPGNIAQKNRGRSGSRCRGNGLRHWYSVAIRSSSANVVQVSCQPWTTIRFTAAGWRSWLIRSECRAYDPNAPRPCVPGSIGVQIASSDWSVFCGGFPTDVRPA